MFTLKQYAFAHCPIHRLLIACDWAEEQPADRWPVRDVAWWRLKTRQVSIDVTAEGRIASAKSLGYPVPANPRDQTVYVDRGWSQSIKHVIGGSDSEPVPFAYFHRASKVQRDAISERLQHLAVPVVMAASAVTSHHGRPGILAQFWGGHAYPQHIVRAVLEYLDVQPVFAARGVTESYRRESSGWVGYRW